MFSVALLPLLLSGTLPNATTVRTTAARTDPSVQVSLDHQTYERGNDVRVTVQAREDGYLVVLQADPAGRVRVLFPLDPGNDDFVRGGERYEIRGRGDRAAFAVEVESGTGTVYAAWSREPFRFDGVVRGDHWDYGAIGDSALATNPEAGLTNIVERMSTDHFDYDIVSYEVETPSYATTYAYVPAYYPPPGFYNPCWNDPWCGTFFPTYYPGVAFSINIGFGRPFFDPFFFDPFPFGRFHRPCCFFAPRRPFGFAHRPFGFGHRPIFVAGGRGAFSPYGWKNGIVGGSRGIGVQYRPRGLFASNGRPVMRGGGASRFAPASRGSGIDRAHHGGIGFGHANAFGERGTSARGTGWRPNGTGAGMGAGHGGTAVERGRGGRSAADRPANIGWRAEPRINSGRSALGRGNDRPREGVRSGAPALGRGVRAEPRSGSMDGRAFERPNVNVRQDAPPTRATPRFDSPERTPQRAASPRFESPRFESPRQAPERVQSPRFEPRSAPPARAEPRSAPALRVERSVGGGRGGWGGGGGGAARGGARGGGGGGRHH